MKSMDIQKDTENTQDAFDTSINARLKQIRLALKLTQAQFCKGIFLTSGHYAGIELGNRRVNERIIRLVTTIYGVSETFLRTGTGDMFNNAADPRLERLIRIFQELPPDFQDYILQQIDQLKKLHHGA
ncbi:MAG: helix-turn-helix domain-containing protein [Treponema sp.]|jgi:transcriptional regulator with XRE-family HTH domain|nr:helix-turn-helix domain-containing protein [Treponema sp.]